MTKKTIFAIVLANAFFGCVTEPKVESTEPWEGHYYTVEEMKQKTADMQLGKDESIWVLSNQTLNRLLKNIGK